MKFVLWRRKCEGMRISLDKDRCIKCGICIRRMDGFCIKSNEGFPEFNDRVCNTCQKCVAICPSQAIMVNGKYPERIANLKEINSDDIFSILERRRSIKKFQKKEIPKEVLEKILSVAKFAPNQNKNISIVVIKDAELIKTIDEYAVEFVKKFYKLLFGLKIFTKFISIFYKDIYVIKEKMEYRNFESVLYENTQIIIIATGNKHAPVTESSSHYLLANLMIMAEALGVGSCLMDSVLLTLKTNRELRKRLDINEDVLCAMVLGYSDENIVNIPRGYEVEVRYE